MTSTANGLVAARPACSGELRRTVATSVAVLLVAVLGMATLLLGASSAHAATGEVVTSFASRIEVQPDGDLRVQETIQYRFSGSDKHGIKRRLVTMLGVAGNDSKVRVYPLSDISVSSPTGASSELDVSESGDETVLRVGSADRTVQGTQTYVLRYTVRGAFNRFTAPVTDAQGATSAPHDELYWNVTGDGWDVPIQSAQVTVAAPQAATDVRCYRGVRGSSDTCTGTAGQTSTFSASGLAAGQGMTVLLAYPLDTVSNAAPILKDAPRQGLDRLKAISPLSVGGAGVLFAAIAGAMSWLVRRRGRDAVYVGLTPGLAPVAGQAVATAEVSRHAKDAAVQFTPPAGMRPGEIGTLVDEVANTVDVTATIIDLAVRGFLRIEEVMNGKGTKVKDWRLVVVLPAPEGEELLPYELALMQALFKGRNEALLKADLRDTFAKDLKATQDRLYDEVTRRGWFRGNPQAVRRRYAGFGTTLIGFGFVGAWLAGFTHVNLLVPALGVLGGGVVALALSKRMPARTADGSAVLTQALGFRRYLETAEASQIRFEEGQDVFSRYLPYAIIFGVAERWAGIFDQLAREGRALEQPGWYVGSSPTWTYLALGNSMSSFETTANSSLVSTPASSGSSGFSSGGGFSGGGGGGGGGGSW